MRSNPAFFRSGLTRACFSSWGISPVVNEILTILVMIGRNSSMQWRISQVGRGSSLQCFTGMFNMSFFTSLSERALNWLNLKLVLILALSPLHCFVESSFDHIFFIFSSKNLLKSFTKSVSLLWCGRGGACFLFLMALRILSIALSFLLFFPES